MKGIAKTTLMIFFLVAGGLALTPAASMADDKGGHEKHRVEKSRDHDRQRAERRREDDRHAERRWEDDRHEERRHVEKRIIRVERPEHYHRPKYYKDRRVVIIPPERYYRGVRIYRPYGYRYPGYGFFYADLEAYRWLAFTAITLAILDNLNEQQQRLHEQAQIRATTARVGETIVWEDGGASGSVTTTRVGTSTSGRQCREFQQTVTIGGKSEQAYGTACLQPDGSWELVK